MSRSFKNWEIEGVDGERNNATLIELKNLFRLRTFVLHIRNANLLPKDVFRDNLERYNLVIGGDESSVPSTSSRVLHLTLHEGSLIKNSEVLLLGTFEEIASITQLDINGFPELKNLQAKSND